MFAMQGYCPREFFLASMPMALKSLTYTPPSAAPSLLAFRRKNPAAIRYRL